MTKSILFEIDAQIALLRQAKALLSSAGTTAIKRKPGRPSKTAAIEVPVAQKAKKRKKMSAEGRERVRQAQIKRWAALKGASKANMNATVAPRQRQRRRPQKLLDWLQRWMCINSLTKSGTKSRFAVSKRSRDILLSTQNREKAAVQWIARRTACALALCMMVGCRMQTDKLAEKQRTEISVDIETARAHEIAPVRHLLHADDMKDGFRQLQLELKVSRLGDVLQVKASSPNGAMKYWPRLESEVRRWKFRPFEVDGKAVDATLDDYINIVSAERLPKVHVRPPTLNPDSKILITLERTACMGSCPAYKVDLSANGVVFDGYYFVAAPGRHALGIDPVQVRALAQKFVNDDFYSMEPKYEYGVTDNPTFTLSIDIDGHRKKVVDYVGDEMGMPEIISDLEDAVDSLAATNRWIQGDGLMATLHAEQFDFHSFQAQVIAKQAAIRGKTALLRDLLSAGVPVTQQMAPASDSSSPTFYLYEQMAKIGWLDSGFTHPDALQLLMERGVSRDDQHDKDVALAGAAQMGDALTPLESSSPMVPPDCRFEWQQDHY